MPTLASDVMNSSRAVLNDIAMDLYTDEVLLPYLKIANDDLSDELVDNGSTVTKEVTVDIPLLIGAKQLILPNDLIVPIQCYEKDSSQGDEYYRQMDQRDFLPNGVPGTELGVWIWQGQQIQFIGSTQDKKIRVRYHRLILEITGVNTPLELTHAKNYLAYHTAALAAEHIGQNRGKAIDLEGVAIGKLNKLLKKEVKQSHSKPTRRRPFKLNRQITYTR